MNSLCQIHDGRNNACRNCGRDDRLELRTNHHSSQVVCLQCGCRGPFEKEAWRAEFKWNLINLPEATIEKLKDLPFINFYYADAKREIEELKRKVAEYEK